MSVVDEVKQGTDIVAVIAQYTTLSKAGRTLRALCPFHSEKHPSFFVYPEQQSWHCFGSCSTGGDVFSFLMKKENINFGETLRFLAQRAGVTIPSKLGKDPERGKKERLYQVNEDATRYFHSQLLSSPLAEKARQYLTNRAVLDKAITDFQLGFSLNSWEALKRHLSKMGYTNDELFDAGLITASADGKAHDRFRGRLMFPIRDDRGHITGFGTRVLDDSSPKYINSPQTPIFDKSGSLYGINLAASAIRQLNKAVIVEGYFDVIIAHQYGFANVVASMGTAITDKQVNILKRLTGNLVLALDADSAGEEAMLRCVSYENTLDSELKVILLPEGKDPDDVIKENTSTWQELAGKATPVVDYTFDINAAKLDLTTASDKSLAARRLLPIIAEIKDMVRQSHYLQKLASLINVNGRNLEAELRKINGAQEKRLSKREILTPRPISESLLSNPLEEYCLTLLLRCPELKEQSESLLPEYFDNIENREIFLAWQQVYPDISQLRDKLDVSIREHFEAIANKDIPAGQIEQKYSDCILNLRKRFLQNLEIKRAEVLLSERELGGTAAELAKQEEQGIEVKTRLLEIFTQKTNRG
ncbi:MAG: DNA primase [Dehalococcoidales bacterium]|jgi:DNA primase|nr:DNA primase [Dehalococcoidales bacterium]MDP6221979.1 DNA primase [Dehalococcoidales bacterium]MDP7110094.1 DNA primase [Dehalococcoidales bacterium]MDP7309632.1 DNA primase [Dehalococcoidales bacterium]MDP7409435.1 DNA primase [Dehalococcoidales bacterium]|tara:strand:- start:1049 stop:2815 length:1767 start_codon:yes stop_codon:yes gene_type:complete